ncbi:MAG: 2-C-methyl-D-erythritol 4-phosphate cytidylyltransferase [Acidimicrobiales bacterium]|nr:2-C-methyl-D-erythritol 4-phosphate cytidylyltransferase [Acidimicrobiales bacterium]
MSVWAIVLAAGSGRRFGAKKQYLSLGGRRVLDWSLAAAGAACDGVVVVVSADDVDDPEPAADVVVAGGAERSDSVRAGLSALPDDCDVVVVHDGARPFADADLFRAVIDAVRRGADGAVPGVPVTDTIKRVAADTVVETIERSALVAVQTPQAFRRSVLLAAHASSGDATDDAGLVEIAGGRVVVEPGRADNIKITRAEDLPVAEVLARRRGPGGPAR